MTGADGTAPAQRTLNFLPPFRVLRDFLQDEEADALLDHAAGLEAAFTPTYVGRPGGARIDPALRVSSCVRDLGAFGPRLRDRLKAMAPALTAELRVTPFQTAGVELELVTHGDGAFYGRHIDTARGGADKILRVVSGVFYVHRRPKRFAGGALRLYSFGDADRFVDIEPDHNTLLVFPAWAPHEVRPVSCASGAFMDSRFAVNCWLYAARPGSGPAENARKSASEGGH